MGYNISRHSFIRNKPQLDNLLTLRRTFEIPTAHPRRLAMKLWEAIKSAKMLAKKFPDGDFEKYVELGHLYKFRQTQTGVRCEWVMTAVEQDILVDDEAVPTQSLPAPTKMQFPEAISLIDVIATAIEHGDAPEIHFPNANLSEEDKKKLFAWTKQEDVVWSFISHDNAGLTLTTKEVPEEILWRPKDEQAKVHKGKHSSRGKSA